MQAVAGQFEVRQGFKRQGKDIGRQGQKAERRAGADRVSGVEGTRADLLNIDTIGGYPGRQHGKMPVVEGADKLFQDLTGLGITARRRQIGGRFFIETWQIDPTLR